MNQEKASALEELPPGSTSTFSCCAPKDLPPGVQSMPQAYLIGGPLLLSSEKLSNGV